MKPAPISLPSDTPAIEPTVMREQTASPTAVASEPAAGPTVVPGSFDDFYWFAAEIEAALQDSNVSFFDEHLASSRWLCLGDETIGVCKDAPADTTLAGIPVTYDWANYEVHSTEKYRERWQTAFASRGVLELVAVANQFGGNPLMPMASQSFLAVVRVADEGNPASIQEVRVLFFEYRVNAWYLAGELVAVEGAEAWLNNTCIMCYDTWAAWPE
jgi:hypothetical protein